MKHTHSLKALFVTLTLISSSGARAATDPCVSARIAFDIGSGSTKARSLIVNTCYQTVIKELAKVSDKIGWKQELGKNKKITPEFMDKALTTIFGLRDQLRATTVEKLTADPQYAYLATSPIKVASVATEWIRQVEEADLPSKVRFLAALKKEFMNPRALTQKEEGRLGYIGVMALSGSNPRLPSNPADYISWDIGGASLQMVAYSKSTAGTPWTEFGNRLASEPIRCYVVEQFQKKPCFTERAKASNPTELEKVPSSANPLVTSDYANLDDLLQGAVSFVGTQFSQFDTVAPSLRTELQSGGRKVVGIGGVHGATLAILRTLPKYASANGYTQADLVDLIQTLSVKSDADLIAQHKGSPDFVSGTVSNIVLVHAVMKLLNIQEVQVADVDNSFGVAVSPMFWGGSPSTLRADGTAAINP